MRNNPDSSFEKSQSTLKFFKKAFPVHEVFEWSMPETDDPLLLEKLGQQPIWGNKFREDDVPLILKTLEEVGFDTSAVAKSVSELYQEAGEPKTEKDLKDNSAGRKWVHLITSLLHIVTTDLIAKKTERGRLKFLPKTVLTPEEKELPLEERHGFQNNIAAGIVMVQSEKTSDLKPLAEEVVTLFNKGKNRTKEEEKSLFELKLRLEKAYFQKLFPDFFTK